MRELHLRPIAVTGIGEKQLAVRPGRHVIRSVVASPLIPFGQHRHLPGGQVGSHQPPATPRSKLRPLARNQPALGVKQIPIRPTALFAVHGGLTSARIQAQNPVVPDVGEEDPPVGMCGGPFQKRHADHRFCPATPPLQRLRLGNCAPATHRLSPSIRFVACRLFRQSLFAPSCAVRHPGQPGRICQLPSRALCSAARLTRRVCHPSRRLQATWPRPSRASRKASA